MKVTFTLEEVGVILRQHMADQLGMALDAVDPEPRVSLGPKNGFDGPDVVLGVTLVVKTNEYAQPQGPYR